MRRILLASMLGWGLLAACMVGPGPRGAGMIVVPALPSIVVLEEEPYYYQGGYHYQYQNDRWLYSNSRVGPWTELPRDHYPKEVKFKGRGQGKGRGDGNGHGEDRGRGKNERD
jgi:hypothetical protein